MIYLKLIKIYHLFPDEYNNIPIYCLENCNKIEVGLMRMGACIVFARTPDCYGIIRNIALSLQNYCNYKEGVTYAGATIGPVAGRIRGGLLRLPDGVHILPKNEGKNTLHGGPENLAHTLWDVSKTFCNDHEVGIVFKKHLWDGQNGFPGERNISVRYSLSCENILTIQYTATTDKVTWLNLTNHTYWNLTGNFSKPAHRQILQINANQVYYNDDSHLPIYLKEVKNSPFDFTSPRSVANALRSNPTHKQLRNALGYNNIYVLQNNLKPAVILADPVSGRCLTVATDYPNLLFYSGGYLDGAGYTLDGQKINASSAYAFEAQYLPDAPNRMGIYAPLLQPGEVYHKAITFHFN